jgi:SAM-dependent methyltransferase
MAQGNGVERADYGVDAPAVLRNLFLFGGLCLLLGWVGPHRLHVGRVVFKLGSTLLWTGGCLVVEGFLYLLYVKKGKLKHRDYMLSMHDWRGDEQVLDVGCGRGLLLVGAAKKLTTGKATGIDLWSNVDMGGNSAEATLRNLRIEGVSERCEVLSGNAQKMGFADGSFDVIVSNLCLHNIRDAAGREMAQREMARVLRPGGVALISDYKRTGEYAKKFAGMGLAVTKRSNWKDAVVTFPPLTVVAARKGVGAN